MFDIRLVRPEDRSDLYEICLKTADSGEDGTDFYTDPLLVGHIYAGPYLACAPQFAFVLEDEYGVCGYVLGAVDTAAFEAELEQVWWPPLREIYPDPAGIAAQEHSPDQRMMFLTHHPAKVSAIGPAELLVKYPSHLHIDLLPRAQGQGWGKKLMQQEFKALKEAGSVGVHLGFGHKNPKAQAFYLHLGATELQRWSSGVTMGWQL